jgi:hypothetical protein
VCVCNVLQSIPSKSTQLVMLLMVKPEDALGV